MYTQCPECRTLFRVTRAQLDAAEGRVCCGRCSSVFDANRTLRADLPRGWRERSDRSERRETQREEPLPEDFSEASADEPDAEAPEPDRVQFTLLDTPSSEGARPRAPEGAEGTANRTASSTSPPPVLWTDLAEAEAEERAARRGPWRGLAWGLALLIVAAGIPAQYGYFHFDELAQRAELRPYLASLCQRLECHIPARRALERIELVSRSVRSHPSVDDALLITATFVNNATFTQPYPTVEVMLSDIDERTVATRRFQPREYLTAERDADSGLAPAQRAQLELEVVDPGVHVTNFRFKFL